MSDLPNIINVTRAGYARDVLENSKRAPVLVDFWADWCGPCKMQMPVLEKLAQEYQGKLLIAKINTDQERTLAAEQGIRSLPTLRLVRNGAKVEEVLGAQTESTLRAIIDRYIERQSDAVRAAADAALTAGDADRALALLRSAHAEDPDNQRVTFELVRVCIAHALLDEADEILSALPASVRQESAAQQEVARLEFARTAQDLPDAVELAVRLNKDAGDLDARYGLAVRQVMSGEYSEGMENFLEIMRRDRKYRDDGARKALLSAFNLLGDQPDLVSRVRARMFKLLY